MIRRIDFNTDYNDYVEWFKYWGWEAPPKEFLPNTTFILEEEGVKICSCAMYLSISGGLCFAEWFIVNPKAPRKLRKDCIKKLLTFITKQANLLRYKCIFTSTKNLRLIEHLKQDGFVETDLTVTNLLKVIKWAQLQPES